MASHCAEAAPARASIATAAVKHITPKRFISLTSLFLQNGLTVLAEHNPGLSAPIGPPSAFSFASPLGTQCLSRLPGGFPSASGA
jgi:hypothetical protein